MNIHKASEDYLEAMLILKQKKGYVRSIDVSRKLNVTKPSVSYATKRLRENGCIYFNEDGFIEFTDEGMKIAQKIYDRHKKLSQFLKMLGVDEDVADADACKIEHDISNDSFNALCEHVEKHLQLLEDK